jgi:hypothetical protein
MDKLFCVRDLWLLERKITMLSLLTLCCLFYRLKGLLRSGALKEEDKPMWYDIYEAFPPHYEPRYDRPAPDIPIRNVLYLEDTIRA